MVAIAATTNATPSLQMALMRTRVEQAQREADRAEADARDLRSQADRAEQEAQSKQKAANGLAADTRNIALTYSAPVKVGNPAAAPQVPPQTQDFLIRLYRSTSQKFAASGNPLKTDADAPPVLNSQGQATGRIINIRA